MKYLKRQNTNIRNIAGKGVIYDINDQVILDTTNVVLVPKGTGDGAEPAGTALNQRPNTPTEGHFRYNTTTNEFEGFQAGAWRKFRFKEPRTIHVDPLGTGDDVEIRFGPLNTGDPDFEYPLAAQNMLVFIENVYQLPNTNYSLIQNPIEISPSTGLAYPAGYYLLFNEPVPINKDVTVIHGFDK